MEQVVQNRVNYTVAFKQQFDWLTRNKLLPYNKGMVKKLGVTHGILC